jgi:hypothetical protein
MQYDIDLDTLASRLLGDFSRTILQGALRVLDDNKNQIRGNLFASAILELLAHMLHEVATDNELKQCSWFKVETDDGRYHAIGSGRKSQTVADVISVCQRPNSGLHGGARPT